MTIAETSPDFYGNSCDRTRPTQVRKIKPTRRSLSGIYAFRGETAIPYESSLERDFLIRMAFNRDVLAVIPQPVRMSFTATSGRVYPYTPDFLVYFKLGDHDFDHYPKPLLVEVKPRAEIQKHWNDWKPKFRAAHRYSSVQGWAFKIYDESRIRDTTLDNIRFLERYKTLEIDPEDAATLLSTVSAKGCVNFDYLLARHYGGIYLAEGIAHIWHLLATWQIECDISLPLSNTTELWMPNHGQG